MLIIYFIIDALSKSKGFVRCTARILESKPSLQEVEYRDSSRLGKFQEGVCAFITPKYWLAGRFQSKRISFRGG
jgi:hypothetical protein